MESEEEIIVFLKNPKIFLDKDDFTKIVEKNFYNAAIFAIENFKVFPFEILESRINDIEMFHLLLGYGFKVKLVNTSSSEVFRECMRNKIGVCVEFSDKIDDGDLRNIFNVVCEESKLHTRVTYMKLL